MLTIPEKAQLDSNKRWLIGLVIGLMVAIFLVFMIKKFLFANKAYDISYSQAEQGSVVQQIGAFGRLKPRVSNSLVAEVNGHVSELNVFPGTYLNENTLVLTLSNPQLMRQYHIAELNWQKAQAEHALALARLEREATQLANDVAMVNSELKFAEQEITTLSTLHQSQLLSDLDFLKAKTRLEQTRLKLDLNKRSEQAFLSALASEKKALNLSLEAEKLQLALVKADVENLQVVAKQAGILTELHEGLEVGQAITEGMVLAKLSNKESLFAELLVPASNADLIEAGMPVDIAIKNNTYRAQVVRIHPNVEANQIKIEASFIEQVPSSAVSNLSVSAKVLIAEKSNTLRIAKPVYFVPNQKVQSLFVYQDQNIIKKTVTIGLQGDKYIEVIDGLSLGEQVLNSSPQG